MVKQDSYESNIFLLKILISDGRNMHSGFLVVREEDDDISHLAYPSCRLLASGLAGNRRVSNHLATPASIPDTRDCCRGSL